MSTSRPLRLAAIGVVALTLFQGCTIPGLNQLQPKPVAYGILKLDPTIQDGDFRDKFGAVNSLEGGGDITKTAIASLRQIDRDTFYAITRSGTLINTNSGGRNWRSVSVPSGFTVTSFDYTKAGEKDYLVVGGISQSTGKILISTGGESLKEVYSDVPGSTSIQHVFVSRRDPKVYIGIVRNSSADEIIVSNDSAFSWKKIEKLPAQARGLAYQNNRLELNLTNNTLRIQNNSDDYNATYTSISNEKKTENLSDALQKLYIGETIIKTKSTQAGVFTLTDKGLYKTSLEGNQSKFSLPITDSPILDFDVNPFDLNHYIAGAGNRILESFNAGATWTIRSDVGNEAGAGNVSITLFDVFQPDQIYLGRSESAVKK